MISIDKPIHRFIFGLHENETNQEVIAVVFNDETNMKISLTAESMKWVSEICKRTGAKINSLNRLSPEWQKMWNELHGS